MFTDRFRFLKMGVATLVLLGLVLYSGWGMDEHNPSMEDCQREPERFAGRQVYVGAAEVVAREPGMLRVLEGQTAIHFTFIDTEAIWKAVPMVPKIEITPGKVGDVMSATGEFVPPDTLLCYQYVIHEGYAWKRPLVYVVSAGGLMALFLIVLRRYRLVPGIPALRPRD